MGLTEKADATCNTDTEEIEEYDDGRRFWDEAASNVIIVLASRPPTRLLTIIYMQQLMTASCLWGVDVDISKIKESMQSAAQLQVAWRLSKISW